MDEQVLFSIRNDIDDFILIYSINYLRTYLACLYCQFRSSVILELVNHMQINHLDRSESIEYQHESDDIQNIIR